MAIDLNTVLGTKFNTSNNRAGKSQDERPKAQYWLNIGYTVDVTLEDGSTDSRFISLPTGIPLDTQEMLKTNSNNEAFAMLQGARNDLLEQMLTACKELKAGEERIIGVTDSGLAMQLRRVSEEKPAVKASENPFAKRLAFA